MKVEFLSKFVKDLDKLERENINALIVKVIKQIENAENIAEIQNLKKLKGHKSAYRIKLGEYRIGVYIVSEIVEMARIIHRKDIYKVFP